MRNWILFLWAAQVQKSLSTNKYWPLFLFNLHIEIPSFWYIYCKLLHTEILRAATINGLQSTPQTTPLCCPWIFFKDLFISVLCVSVFYLHVFLCTVCKPGDHRGQNWSSRELLAAMWALGIKHGSSETAAVLLISEPTLQLCTALCIQASPAPWTP